MDVEETSNSSLTSQEDSPSVLDDATDTDDIEELPEEVTDGQSTEEVVDESSNPTSKKRNHKKTLGYKFEKVTESEVARVAQW